MQVSHMGNVRAIALGILALGSMLGCTLDRWVEVSPGEYVTAGGVGATGQAAAREVRRLTIDAEQRTATFTLNDGAEVVVSFVARPRDEWPSGCPTNINETRMQVLDLAGGTLTIGPLAIDEPVLVRDCPREPVEVVLRAAGEIGGGGSACIGASECIGFERSE